MSTTTAPAPERVAFLRELSETYGTPLERLLAIDADRNGPSSCCGMRSGCARCRPEAWC